MTDSVEAGYRGRQVCAIVGITYRQLDYWARQDLLRPSVADANGSGSQRLYSYRDIVELKVVKRLLDGGVSLQKARKAVEFLRQNLGADLASADLVLDGPNSLLVRTEDELIDLFRKGQGVLNLVKLTAIPAEVEAALSELRPVAGAGDAALPDLGGDAGEPPAALAR
ncbi:MAG: MerR family transcriptional regulator [Acidimicrobiia bacterium]